MNFFTNPNLGPVTALVTAFLSALMAALDAFTFFHFNATQQNAVLALAIASVAVGLYLFSILHVNIQNTKVSAGVTPVAPVAPTPPAGI